MWNPTRNAEAFARQNWYALRFQFSKNTGRGASAWRKIGKAGREGGRRLGLHGGEERGELRVQKILKVGNLTLAEHS